MNGFYAYGITCFASVVLLAFIARFIKNILFAVIVTGIAGLSPLWLQLVVRDAFVPDSMLEGWDMAWGIGHMLFGLPTVIGCLLALAIVLIKRGGSVDE